MDKVYEDEFVTEYDDGTEEVRFTDAEWAEMLSDPKFGYVCRNGHRLSDGDRYYGGCLTCEYEAEAAYDEWLDENEPVLGPPDFRSIDPYGPPAPARYSTDEEPF